MTSSNHRNRLANESSPYLRQHASNPVDWYPWGDEAFNKAKAEDKPVFLSVGYSSCHWCHVMAHESFEHPDVAEILNRDFIPVKVDREEHPDVDALYMTATQLITQRGGWPNSLWLTPDQRPWYAGTYFPREDRHGRIGFVSLLQRLTALWKDRRKDVEEQANQLTDAIRKQHESKPTGEEAAIESDMFVPQVQSHYQNQFDPRHGGFGDAPKFPPHSGLLLLLRCQEVSPSNETNIIIRSTLDAMLRGGIYDQIGGGFHRYSTDEKWLLPHFEKMLYDNALLLKLYAIAFDRYQDPAYHRVVMETAGWLSREMTHPGGGFYSALDADSEGEEGKYYTWSYEELSSFLDPDALRQFTALYQIMPGGNFDDEASGHSTGLNIPHLRSTVKEIEIHQIAVARGTLLQHRHKRVHPGLDDKVITAWNGLMISALAAAGKILQHQPFIDRALQSRNFIDQYLTVGKRLARCWCGHPSTNEGMLDDYAAIALADLDLFDATGRRDHLENAAQRIQFILEQFYDENTGALFMTSQQHTSALIRMKDVYDQGSPSGVGLAVQAMMRLAVQQSDETLIEIARRITAHHHMIIQRAPSAVASLVEGLLIPACSEQVSHEVVGIKFAVTPVPLVFNQSGHAQGELTVKFPDGWHLSDSFKGISGFGQPFELTAESNGHSLDSSAEQSGPFTWILHIKTRQASPRPMDHVVIHISYQPCTESECLPVQQALIRSPVTQAP